MKQNNNNNNNALEMCKMWHLESRIDKFENHKRPMITFKGFIVQSRK